MIPRRKKWIVAQTARGLVRAFKAQFVGTGAQIDTTEVDQPANSAVRSESLAPVEG